MKSTTASSTSRSISSKTLSKVLFSDSLASFSKVRIRARDLREARERRVSASAMKVGIRTGSKPYNTMLKGKRNWRNGGRGISGRVGFNPLNQSTVSAAGLGGDGGGVSGRV
jgi:hypothetical protein